MTCDCLLAQAPIWDPRGRDLKYGSLAACESICRLPSAVTWRPIAYQGNTAQATGCAARSRPLREVRLV